MSKAIEESTFLVVDAWRGFYDNHLRFIPPTAGQTSSGGTNQKKDDFIAAHALNNSADGAITICAVGHPTNLRRVPAGGLAITQND